MNAPTLNEPQLPLASYRFRFRAKETVCLPDYSGSAWRGIFGTNLKKLVCVTREPECEPCLLYRSCIYPYIFETPPDPGIGKLRKYNAAPHPFTLCPGDTFRGVLEQGTEHYLDITLFGHGNRHLPYIIHSLDKAAQRGIGKGRGALELLEVSQQIEKLWVPIYHPGDKLEPQPAACVGLPPCPQKMKLRLITSLRIKTDEHLVTPERFGFKPFFSTLLRRISMLTAFHTDTPLETDFAGLTHSATKIKVSQHELRWKEWTRYSSRQDTTMQFGGLLGTVQFDTESDPDSNNAGSDGNITNGFAPFWPYLWLGQWTHVGKNTSMGLGKYEIIESV